MFSSFKDVNTICSHVLIPKFVLRDLVLALPPPRSGLIPILTMACFISSYCDSASVVSKLYQLKGWRHHLLGFQGRKERRPPDNSSALSAVKGEAEAHRGQGSGASGDSPALTTSRHPGCSLSHQAPADEPLAATTSPSHASCNIQGTWAFSPVCWLESRSVLERFSPQQVLQNPTLDPNTNFKSCSSQAGKA